MPLICSIKISEERRVVGFLFFLDKSSTNFILTIVRRFVALFLEPPAESSCGNILLVHPRRVVVLFRGDLLSGGEFVKGLGDSRIETKKVVFKSARVSFKRGQRGGEVRGKGCVIQLAKQSAILG